MSLYHSISQIKNNYATDQKSAHEYTEQVCKALETRGRNLHAVKTIEAEFVHRQIEQCFASEAPGKSLLSAVPLAHKELYGRKPEDEKGWPFEAGSRAHQGERATQNAHVINLLDQHGALDCGRLVTVEYALGVTGHNEHAGTPKNPFNHAYICGGSSSGSAACVAGGIIPASLGSDTGGSIRLPAAACGLVGIKPTHGLVSRSGVHPLSDSLDTVGPLSRSVLDSALILSAIAGYDEKDSSSLEVHIPQYHHQLDSAIAGVKIGLEVGYFLSGADTEIADNVTSAFEAAEQFGTKLIDFDCADIAHTNPLNILLISTEAADIHLEKLPDIHDELNPQTLMRILTGLYTTAETHHRLLQMRAGIAAELIDKLFQDVDVFITPVWPFALPTIEDSDVGAKPEAAGLMQRIGHNTRPINFLGLPAVVIPIGLDKNGLPLSIQLVGKPFAEKLLLRVAFHFEQHFAFWQNRTL